MHFWSFWAKYCHFLHILSNARPKNNVNKVPRWVFRYVGNKAFDFSSKEKDFLPKNNQNWHFWSIWPGYAGLFSALLVGRLVVVARGLYLARYLFTLSKSFPAGDHSQAQFRLIQERFHHMAPPGAAITDYFLGCYTAGRRKERRRGRGYS